MQKYADTNRAVEYKYRYSFFCVTAAPKLTHCANLSAITSCGKISRKMPIGDNENSRQQMLVSTCIFSLSAMPKGGSAGHLSRFTGMTVKVRFALTYRRVEAPEGILSAFRASLVCGIGHIKQK